MEVGRRTTESLLAQDLFGHGKGVRVFLKLRQFAHQPKQLGDIRLGRFPDHHVWLTEKPAKMRIQPSQKNFVGRSISGGRLLCTGQLSAALSSKARCGVVAGSGI